jgi:serine/threonine protein kinase
MEVMEAWLRKSSPVGQRRVVPCGRRSTGGPDTICSMDPTRLGPYTIRGRLGRGGMGTVYEGIDEAGVSVAVKTLSAHLGDDTGLRRRFEAEIEALKGLRHPGIVRPSARTKGGRSSPWNSSAAGAWRRS